jgi:hypothetical protein
MPPQKPATLERPRTAIDTPYPALLARLEQRIRVQAEALTADDEATDGDAWKRRELSELLDLAYKVRRHIEQT